MVLAVLLSIPQKWELLDFVFQQQSFEVCLFVWANIFLLELLIPAFNVIK